jgi:hypothetical protein
MTSQPRRTLYTRPAHQRPPQVRATHGRTPGRGPPTPAAVHNRLLLGLPAGAPDWPVGVSIRSTPTRTSSMTPASQRTAWHPRAWPANTPAPLANAPTARSPSVCKWPVTTPRWAPSGACSAPSPGTTPSPATRPRPFAPAASRAHLPDTHGSWSPASAPPTATSPAPRTDPCPRYG